MDLSAVDEILQAQETVFRAVLCNAQDIDGDALLKKLDQHHLRMINAASSFYPSPPNSSRSSRSSRNLRSTQRSPSIHLSDSNDDEEYESHKRNSNKSSPKKRKLERRRSLRSGPAQMNAVPIDKSNADLGTARNVVRPNMFGKVNAKLPPVSKPVAEISSRKAPSTTVDLTSLDDLDNGSAGSAPEPEVSVEEIIDFLSREDNEEEMSTNVREISKGFLDIQRVAEESLSVEGDGNGLGREEERERMRGRREGDGLGAMRDVSGVDEDIMAGFARGKDGEEVDWEMEAELMYPYYEEGVMVEEDGEGEGEDEETPLKRRRRV